MESVLIPNEERGYTQCISSQVGCAMDCQFCATASLGLHRNLAAWEIVDQVYLAQDLLEKQAEERGEEWPGRITNLVYMGMGEPLHNFNQVARSLELLMHDEGAAISGKRITVSSSGLVPAIERFGREGLGMEVGLAISLNATTDEVRDEVMPVNRRWKIEKLLEAVEAVPRQRRRRLTFEYVLLADVNRHRRGRPPTGSPAAKARLSRQRHPLQPPSPRPLPAPGARANRCLHAYPSFFEGSRLLADASRGRYWSCVRPVSSRGRSGLNQLPSGLLWASLTSLLWAQPRVSLSRPPARRPLKALSQRMRRV